jgi:hypothetical protein
MLPWALLEQVDEFPWRCFYRDKRGRRLLNPERRQGLSRATVAEYNHWARGPVWLIRMWENRERRRTSIEWVAESLILKMGFAYLFQEPREQHRIDFLLLGGDRWHLSPGEPTTHSAGVAVEVDGVHFHSDDQARERDARIDARLQAAGLRVVRLRSDDESGAWRSKLAEFLPLYRQARERQARLDADARAEAPGLRAMRLRVDEDSDTGSAQLVEATK